MTAETIADTPPPEPSGGLVGAGGPDEEHRARDLRRMKLVATGLFLFAGLVYLMMVLWQEGWSAPTWSGYVEAAAEAGMVGALADWFAVTALFRHPLGIPIPHTAILPRKKDMLARSLAEFMQTNFLSVEVVVDKVNRARPVERAGQWLAEPANASRAAAELSEAALAGLRGVRDEDVTIVIRNALLTYAQDYAWAPPLGRLLEQSVADKTHRGLVTIGFDRLHEWLETNRDSIIRRIADQGPVSQRGPVRFAHELVATQIHRDLMRFAREVGSDPDHKVRDSIDAYLLGLAEDLLSDPAAIERVERLKSDLLRAPEVHRAIADVWPTARRMLETSLTDPASDLRARIADTVGRTGERMLTDPGFRAQVEGRLDDAVRYLVTRYGAEVATLITDTIERWDTAETSRRIELYVGRDLQYIRINGTVVGALAGLAIHSVTQLLT